MKIGKREFCFIHAQPWQRGFWREQVNEALSHIGMGFTVFTIERIDK